MNAMAIMLSLGGAVLVVGLVLNRLTPRGAGRWWSASWAVFFATGVFYAYPGSPPLAMAASNVLGTMAAALQLAGALAFARRSIPSILWYGAGAAALFRAGLWLGGAQLSSLWVYLLTSGGMALAAALVLWPRQPGRTSAGSGC